VNVDLKYLKAVKRGQLRTEGRCLRAASVTPKRRCTTKRGELVAHGTSTLMALPGKGLQVGVPKFLD
jgi:acyl-coenzyme A thioesterase PaaI-like protein